MKSLLTLLTVLALPVFAAPGDFTVSVVAHKGPQDVSGTARYLLEYSGNTNWGGISETPTVILDQDTPPSIMATLQSWVVEINYPYMISQTTNAILAVTVLYNGDSGYPDYEPISTAEYIYVTPNGDPLTSQIGISTRFSPPALATDAWGNALTGEAIVQKFLFDSDEPTTLPPPITVEPPARPSFPGIPNPLIPPPPRPVTTFPIVLPRFNAGLMLPNTTYPVEQGTTLGSYTHSGNYTSDANGFLKFTNHYCESFVAFSRIKHTSGTGNVQNWTNVVGSACYVFPAGKTAFSVPFLDGANTLQKLFGTNVPNGAGIMTQTGYTLSFTTNVYSGGAWSNPNMTLDPGKGYIFVTPSAYTNVFDGVVPGGSHTNNPPQTGGTFYAFLGSVLPKAGYIADLGFDNDDDDTVTLRLWNGTAWEETTWTEEDGWTALSSFAVHADKGPWLAVGQPVMVKKQGSAKPKWIQSFTP